jgi:Tol biopolymer transport system component
MRPSVLRRSSVMLIALAVLASSAAPAWGATARTRRASVSAGGQQVDHPSFYPAISRTGRFVVFESGSPDLVPGDTNNVTDVFVRDMKERTTTRVSVRSNGRQGNGGSGYASISASGRYVVFFSEATNLAKGDDNGTSDVFVHDRKTGATSIVSVNSRGRPGNDDSAYGSISNDGRFVAFQSDARNLVKGDDNGYVDAFVHDRTLGRTVRVSVNSNGKQGDANVSYMPPGAISADGRIVVFTSAAKTLVKGDRNGVNDVFAHDLATGKTRRVSVSSAGEEGDDQSRDPAVSADGRYVVFTSFAPNLVGGDGNGDPDVFVHDLATGKTRRVSLSSAGTEGSMGADYGTISADGRYVAFSSYSPDLVDDDGNGMPDMFVRDRRTGATVRVSLRSNGTESEGASGFGLLSADGRFVVFQSESKDLIGKDTNDVTDIYVRGPLR